MRYGDGVATYGLCTGATGTRVELFFIQRNQ